MKRAVLIFAAVVGAACSEPPTTVTVKIPQAATATAGQSKPCAPEVHDAVAQKLLPIFNKTPETIAGLDRHDQKLRCVREWAETLKDDCQRDAYLSWISSFEKWSKEAREDLERKPTGDDWLWRYREEQRRIRDWERGHPVPAPPEACERGLIQKVKP